MVAEEELIKNKNAAFISACILYDFSIINHPEKWQNFSQLSNMQCIDGKILNAKKIFNGWLLDNNNYIINLYLMELFTSYSVDFHKFNKDLLIQIIKTSLNFTDLELHKDGWLELKLPTVSY